MIEKKILPKYFDRVASGEKTFELRLADFEIESGDEFVMKEWDPETKEYTGRELRKTAGYILKLDKCEGIGMHTAEENDKYGYYIISLLERP